MHPKERRKLDNKERAIVKELIRDPRISDNRISKNTNVPLRTVNRKRKILEKEGILNYFAYLDNSYTGTKAFGSTHMYILTFKEGISREKFMRSIDLNQIPPLIIKHILFSFIGEKNGKLCFTMLISSRAEQDIIEIFNEEILPLLEMYLGSNIIYKTETLRISTPISLFHNYLYNINQENGKLRKDWPDTKVFVDD